MRTDVVFSLTGPDRVGIVEEVTAILLDLGGNVGPSRMARLGGEFAILMLVSMPDTSPASLDDSLTRLTAEGYAVSARPNGSFVTISS